MRNNILELDIGPYFSIIIISTMGRLSDVHFKIRPLILKFILCCPVLTALEDTFDLSYNVELYTIKLSKLFTYQRLDANFLKALLYLDVKLVLREKLFPMFSRRNSRKVSHSQTNHNNE